jgi:hypothetical protein
LGALPSTRPSTQLHGLVQEIQTDAFDGADGLERFLNVIRAFVRRETSLNPIYRYEAVDVETQGHGTVKALICRADEKSFLFLNRDRSAPGTTGLTLLEKAAIIASARGVPNASARTTGLDYWRFVLHCRYRAGIAPEPHIKELVETANGLRALLPRRKRQELEVIEERGVRLGSKERLDARALRRNARLVRLNARDVEGLQESARRKLGLFEPLPPDRLARTQVLFRQLHT